MSDPLTQMFLRKATEAKDGVVRKCAEDFNALGAEAVGLAKSQHLYHNVTGDLESSVCYRVNIDGVVYSEGGLNGTAAGAAMGMALLDRHSSDDGVELIVGAGMPYAGEVESRGLDVLRSAANHIHDKLRN